MLEFISQSWGFFLKVVIAHVVTYMLCGMFFYKVNHYKEELIDKQKGLNGAKWRSQSDNVYKLVPLFQLLRGALLGIVLVIIKDAVYDTSFGFLKLFLILFITGLINVYQPAPDSIEGHIYIEPEKGLTLKERLGGNIEIAVQIMLFSIIVTTNWGTLFSRL
jgi:F0F1-type ATP synthase assembly protein I